jgi:hypothetical protein
MGIERNLADRKGKDFCELPKETITNGRSKRNRRRSSKKMPPVQKLFETCKEVFASSGTGIVPPTQDIDKLRSVLGTRFLFFYFSLFVSHCFCVDNWLCSVFFNHNRYFRSKVCPIGYVLLDTNMTHVIAFNHLYNLNYDDVYVSVVCRCPCVFKCFINLCPHVDVEMKIFVLFLIF